MYLRRHGAAGALWRVEYQQRGAVHFHVIVWGKANEPLMLSEPEALSRLNAYWHRAIGSTQDAHLVHGVRADVVPLEDEGKVIAYLCKYLAKAEGTIPPWHTGRLWGIIG